MKNPINLQISILNAVHRLSGLAGEEIRKCLKADFEKERALKRANGLAVLVERLGHTAAHNSAFDPEDLVSSITNVVDLYHQDFPVEGDDLDFSALWQGLLKSPNGELRQ